MSGSSGVNITGAAATATATAATSAVGPCGACKFLRRKCISGCIFAPYFDADQGATRFAAVHKVFGASNASKLLLHIPSHKRLDAVVTICYEAQSRLRDPVYGCVAHIFALQQQVMNLQAELSYLHAHLTALELPSPPPLPALTSTTDLPLSSFADLSTLLNPQGQPQWRQPELIRGTEDGCGSSGGELQALARELMDRHRPSITSDSASPAK